MTEKTLADLTRDELRKRAADLNVTGRGKMSKAELVEAVKLAARAQGQTYVTLPDGDENEPVTMRPAAEFEGIQKSFQNVTGTWLDPNPPAESDGEPTGPLVSAAADLKAEIHARVASGAMPMPYGFNGRGVGAKAFLALSERTLHRRVSKEIRKRFEGLGLPATHLPNSERVQKYVWQNALYTGQQGHNGTVPKLTHRQMRRVLSASNKWPGESNIEFASTTRTPEGMSLIARTPEGQGIYFRFAG